MQQTSTNRNKQKHVRNGSAILQDFPWNIVNRKVHVGFDVRGWIYDWQSPASYESISEVGGPDALFMQFRSEYFVQVCWRPVCHLECSRTRGKARHLWAHYGDP